MTGWTTPLSAGTHLAPEDGACLMEAVSAVTGDRWTDSPTSTHPLLAHLARLVNDAVEDETRNNLAAFIPDLVDTNSQDQAMPARIAQACASYALALDDSPLLGHLRNLAERKLGERPRSDAHASLARRGLWAARRWRFEHGTARLAVEASVAQCVKHGDDHLVALLEIAMSAVHRGPTATRVTAG
jgi:hypothetical protein